MKLFGGFLGKRVRKDHAANETPIIDTVQLMREIKNSTTTDGNETPAENTAQNQSEEKTEPMENTEKKRTPEELAEIEAMIAAYQKKKKKRRITALCIFAVVCIGGVIAWKSIVKPPDIVKPTPRPSATPYVDAGNHAQENEPDNQPEATPDVIATETPDSKERERLDGVYTFLLLGREQSYGNTDTIMVGVLNVNENSVNIISIPRDICMNVECDPDLSETKKVNAIFARSGMEGLENALSDLLGFPIDSYVSVGINGFINLVNTIGGVTFDVPYNMNYDDPTQDLHIHFSKGTQYLNGYDAIKVVRWRQNNDGSNYGDIARIQTQQNFLKTVIKQCLSWDNLTSNLDDYIAIFNESVKTDMTTGNMAWYAKQVLKMSMDNITFYTLPCEPSVNIRGFSYGVVKEDEWLELLNEHFNIYDQPITMDDLDLIVLDDNGQITATSGSIRGGYDSFLSYQDYIRRLNEWNNRKTEQQTAASTDSSVESTSTGADTAAETGNDEILDSTTDFSEEGSTDNTSDSGTESTDDTQITSDAPSDDVSAAETNEAE